MFQLYMYDWADNFNVTTGSYSLVTKETLALTIPVNSPDEIWLTNPTVKAEVNKAESFDFSVDTGSKYYNAFIPYKTWLRVVYDGTTIFWGQVKTVNSSTILQKRSIHAEGIYTVFNDTPVEGLEEDLQVPMTMRKYLEFLISNHNSYIEESKKKFTLGNINVTLNSESKARSATSWTTTMSELDNLIDETGGYVRSRYNSNHSSNGDKYNYLDWSKYYFRDLGDGNRPSIKLKKNLIDISKGVESNEIFTRVIPIGHKDTTTNSSSTSTKSNSKKTKAEIEAESSYVYLSGTRYIKVSEVSVNDEFRSKSDFVNAESNYGIIYKTVTFSNASTASDLRTYCEDWIKNNYYGIVHNFTVKALDMHMLGDRESQILVGDCVDVVYPEFDNDGTPHEITRKLICKAIQYNLLNPEANSYTLGVPCDAVDFEYGTKSKKKKSATKAAASAAEEQRTSSGGGTKTGTVNFSTISGWLRWYYRTCPKDDVVDWTETRWTYYGDKYPAKASDYVDYRDPQPQSTWDNNKEFVTHRRVEAGQDSETNEKLYKDEAQQINSDKLMGMSGAAVMQNNDQNQTKVNSEFVSKSDFESLKDEIEELKQAALALQASVKASNIPNNQNGMKNNNRGGNNNG